MTDLTSALRQMDARDWNGAHDEWFALMAACAYVGIRCEDFVKWSITDPHYACDAQLIRRKWRTLEPRHGGALMAALKARGIKIKRADRALIDEVPPNRAEAKSEINLRLASARINAASNAIDNDPTERCLFWAACLCAEIAIQARFKPEPIMKMIAGNAYPALHKTLGREGIRRTVENAFRHVEEKLLNQIDNPDSKGEPHA